MIYLTIQKKALSQGTADGKAVSPTPESQGTSSPIIIEQIDSTDNQVVEEITLYNGWIASITPSELSYESEDLSSYEIEIRYDWAQIL